ncbi:response regulator [Halorubrum lipolyticum]|uniref:histidine kinase n=1 Tax=Halorubrum lipolyticum DSM 21995 TaxID=1227482 RepID=M0P1Z7_9EURY|nr:PAS domain S-box protein [Halorubrum lipolyticum]EMA63878.1 multi-sensor signal transduction histidine kinase [Halorubrum lipolyticum DSM 21995]
MTERDERRSDALAADGRSEPARVLLVADRPDVGDRAAAAIENRADRIDVTLAADAAEGLDLVDAGEVDCVVSGYDLPEMDGVEFLRAVRDRDRDLPFLLFTARGSEAIASEAVAAGVDEYLPVGDGGETDSAGTDDPYATLASRVDRAVSRSHTERRVTEHLDRMTDAFCALDDSWRLTYLNERAATLLDRDVGDLLGERIWDRFETLRGTEIEERFREAMATGEPTAFEFRFDAPDLELAIDAYPSDTGLSVYFRDVTEQRERERELRELSERFRLAVEGADVGVWDWDLTTDEVRFDERWAGMLGYDQSEIAFELSEWEERVHPDDLGEVWAALEAHFAGETEYYQYDHRMETKGGDWKWIRDRGRVVERDEDGAPVRAVGIHIDVTEEKERERDLERYRRLVDELPNSVALYDAEGRFSVVNDRIAEVYDASREELVGRRSPLLRRLRETREGDPFAALVAGDRETLSGTVELDIPERSDAIIDFSLRRLVIDGEFDGVLGITRDVTEERRRQRELERTSARLEALYEDSPDMIDIHDEAGEIVDANPVMAAELGYDREELVGMDVWEIDAELGPTEGTDLWQGIEMGETRRIETAFRRADGTTLPVEVQVRRVDVQGEDRFLATSRDISERKAYERRIERENERLDEFASIVSHDLRNPLNVLSGYLRLARETGEESYFERCESALDEMERLIDDVLTLARQGDAVGSVDPVPLGELATRHANDVFGSIERDGGTDGGGSGDGPGDSAAVVVETEGDVLADPGRLKRLLQNLFRNAAEHGGDRVVVGDLPEGFYVEDDGPGIPEDRRDEVFESGRTTSESGTGFGLAIVERIAEAHGWEVTLTEGEEGGARFEFTGVERC